VAVVNDIFGVRVMPKTYETITIGFREVKPPKKLSRCPSGWSKKGKDCVLTNEKKAMKTLGLRYPYEISLFRGVARKRIRNCLR